MLNVITELWKKNCDISKNPRAIYSLRGKSIIMEIADALNRIDF